MQSVSPGYSHAKEHKKDSTDADDDAKIENDLRYLLLDKFRIASLGLGGKKTLLGFCVLGSSEDK